MLLNKLFYGRILFSKSSVRFSSVRFGQILPNCSVRPELKVQKFGSVRFGRTQISRWASSVRFGSAQKIAVRFTTKDTKYQAAKIYRTLEDFQILLDFQTLQDLKILEYFPKQQDFPTIQDFMIKKVMYYSAK